MLLFQVTGIHIGNDIAVLPGSSRQVQHKGGVQIVQHFYTELRFRIVAFVNHNHRFQMPQHLNQRGVRRIGKQSVPILEELRKTEQISVFLVYLAHIPVSAVNAQGTVAHNADGKHLPHSVRGKVLSIQQHFLGIYAHTSGKVLV